MDRLALYPQLLGLDCVSRLSMHQRIGLSLLVLAGALLLSGVARGAEVAGLYESEVGVAGRDASQRNAGIRAAFKRVLVKVTGNSKVGSRSKVAPALQRASQYVQQYRYRPAPEGGSSPAWLLWVQFDPQAVNQVLQDAGLPVWGNVRPETLLWLAVEERGRRYLLGADTGSSMSALVKQITESRGAPILLPLLDLEDQFQVKFSDVWGDFEGAVVEGSKRYDADVIVVGRLAQGRGGWSVRWSLYQGENAARWDSSAVKREDALMKGLGEAIDVVVSRFAPLAGKESEASVLLEVADIRGLSEYAQVSGYLNTLTPVEKAEPVEVRPSAVVFHLRTRGGLHSLRQALGLGGILSPVSREDRAVHSAVAASQEPDVGQGPGPEQAPAADANHHRLFYRLSP